ncbi:Cwf15/Cwc15 cell cycle control protein [Lactarius sanguifluus]|nr:Cwf15/Cwc15 cell cycle control protein [Lactarius sanguifluus]
MGTLRRIRSDPAQAREVKGGSRQYSVRDMAARTKLKFRQPGQTSMDEVEARAKKRKAAGLPVEDAPMASEDEEANRRRKVLQEADEGDGDGDGANDSKGNAKCAMLLSLLVGADTVAGKKRTDDTAELLRELEKIQRERAAEQARVEQAEAEATEAEREARIATANPLLNLAAAFGNAPGIIRRRPAPLRSSDVGMTLRTPECHGIFTFLDLVFKNQAIGDKAQGQFVNNPLRTEFHKKFMSRFIK